MLIRNKKKFFYGYSEGNIKLLPIKGISGLDNSLKKFDFLNKCDIIVKSSVKS